MTEQKRVLVTGMSGLIGGAIRQRLAGNYALRALNRSPVEGVETVRADIGDLEAIQPAFVDVDTVVHMAAHVGGNWEQLLHANVIGTRNIFEAAHNAGVKRVVYASSGSTVAGWELDEPYKALSEGRYDDVPPSWPLVTHETPVRPRGVYGSTKVWGEALARHYADTTDLSIICLRIGFVNPEDRPTITRHFPIWCSQRDIAQMVERCVEAPDDLRFDTFFVTSQNKWGYRDLQHGREVVGYVPQDAAENYRE